MITATEPVTIDEYVESMGTWIRVSCTRSVRRGSALFAREDMEQEARTELVAVWNSYQRRALRRACLCAECPVEWPSLDELQKIGRRAIWFHTGNLYYRSRNASPRCGECDRCKRVPPAPCRSMQLVNVDADLETVDPRDRAAARAQAGHAEPLDRLLLMESIDDIARESGEARAVLAAALNMSDAAPAPLPSAGRIFKRVQKQVRDVVFRDGYTRVAGHTSTREDVMTDRIESPDEPTAAAVAEAPAPAEAAKPKRSHKKKDAAPKAEKKAAPAKAPKAAKVAKPKAERKTQTAAETKAASTAFKVGDKVTYVGGGRASWLKKDATLEVKGTVVSRGRTYVKCYAIADERPISLSSAKIRLKK
jgi:hypothetical protein